MPKKMGDVRADQTVSLVDDVSELTQSLAPVALSGNYGDLYDKPTLGTAASLNTPISMSSISQPVKSTIDAINNLSSSAAFSEATAFASMSHSHSQADVTGLTAALAGKLSSESDPVALAALTAHVTLTQAHGRYTGALPSNLSVGNVEKSLASVALPANSLRVGSTFKFRAHGNFSMALVQSSLSICRVRIGSLPLLGTVATTVTVDNGKAKVSAPFMVEGEVTVRSIGAVGSIGGWLAMWGATAAPFTDDITALSVFGLVNTAVPNVLEMTYVTTNAAAISVFDVAYIEGG